MEEATITTTPTQSVDSNQPTASNNIGSDGSSDQYLVKGNDTDADNLGTMTKQTLSPCEDGGVIELGQEFAGNSGSITKGPDGDTCLGVIDTDMELSASETPVDTLTSDAPADMIDYECFLKDLPSEILLHITSFVDSRTIIESLSKTCEMFSDYFEDELFWKSRISHRWPKPYPIYPRDNFSWQDGCMEREEAVRAWSNVEENYYHLVDREGCFAAVDIVHLLQEGRFLATGSRDRRITLLDLSKISEENPNPVGLTVFSDEKTHKGWVWSMASHDTTLVTGSWDTSVRLWQLREGGLHCEQNKRLKSAVLSLHYEPGFIAAGCFDKRLYMFDPRAPDDAMVKKAYHSQPILSLAADEKYVITGSEDKVIAIYDRVAGKKFKQIQTDSFVMNMSYGNGQLWTGDKEGKLHVLNTSDGLFDEHSIQTLDVGHSGQLSCVIHTEGAVFSSATNSGIKVLHPTLDPDTICSLNVHSAPIARLSYKNGILASAGSDCSVGVWLPKSLQLS